MVEFLYQNLGIKPECDCNINKSFTHIDFDMIQLHNEKYGRIQVKTAILRKNGGSSLYWYFNIDNMCDTYVMLGFSVGKKDIIKVWVIPSNKSIVSNKQSLGIYLNPKRMYIIAREISKYEVDPKPYNDAYHSMSLDKCGVLTKKDKNEVVI